MMVQVVHGVPRPIDLAMWCEVYRVALSYQVIAHANRAREQSAAWHCIVPWLDRRLRTCLVGHDNVV
jgi:hypothetical protein